jgi:threonyl-tRNA synthetase
MERFIGILIEHCSGSFPLWLAPMQVRILPVHAGHEAFAQELAKKLKKSGIRAEVENAASSLGRRMKQYRVDKIPFALVIGDQEMESGELALRQRGSDAIRRIQSDALIAELKERIANKVRD